MKKIIALIIAVAALTLVGCASAPPTLPTDTLVYFALDVTEVPGAFVKSVFHSTDKTFLVGTAWDSTIRPDNKIVVCYVSIPYDKPVYFSEIHADDSGILTGRRYEMYIMTPQQSPFRIPKSNVKAGIRYGGTFKFKLIKNGLFKANNFGLEACPNCPNEKQILEHLVKIGKEGDGQLKENDYLTKIKARLKSL